MLYPLYTLKELNNFRMSNHDQFGLNTNTQENWTIESIISSFQDLGASTQYDRDLELRMMDQIPFSPYDEDSQLSKKAMDNCLPETKPMEEKFELLDSKIFEEEKERSQELNVEFDDCWNALTPTSNKDTMDNKKQEMVQMDEEGSKEQSSLYNPEEPSDLRVNRTSSANTRSKKLKNYLNCVRRCIVNLQEENLTLIQNEDVQNFLMCKNSKVTKKLFEKLFQNQEAKVILAKILKSHELHRQLQLSVMTSSNRQLFLSQLNLLKKALITGRLPNL